MAMYGVAILPLIETLAKHDVTQRWFADDGNFSGKFCELRKAFDALLQHGPFYGYFVNAPKCKLIVKENGISKARDCFQDTEITITTGDRVLGSVIGDDNACRTYISEKEEKYTETLKKLSKFAKTSPQNVHSCFTKGVQMKTSFLARTTPDTDVLLKNAEKVISDLLIPAIIGREMESDNERSLFSLPIKHGGLDIRTPEDLSNDYNWSQKRSSHLEQNEPLLAELEQQRFLDDIKILKRKIVEQKFKSISDLDDKQKYALERASEKGASCWLNALPMKCYRFNLTKSEFRDGLALRYSWEPKNIPTNCPCGKKFDLTHALHCRKGGYPY